MANQDLNDFEAWLGGDARAGNRLLQRHHRAVYRFFNRKVEGDVGDLVQDTFEVCAASKAKLRDKSSFRAYLLGIARYKLLEYIRGKRVDASFDPSSDSLADLGVTPTQLLHEEQSRRRLLEAMRRLPLDHQLVLEMFYWERLRGKELADVFDIPEDTVRSRLRRARRLLKDALEAIESDPVRLETTLHTLDDLIADLREQASELRGRYPEDVAV